jgi:hypothetical protein
LYLWLCIQVTEKVTTFNEPLSPVEEVADLNH